MKKLQVLTVMGVLLLAPVMKTHAQAAVVSAPILEAIQSNALVENSIYYTQSLVNTVTQIEHAFETLQHAIRTEQRALTNLSAIGNVKSLDDFKSWYNRQLYLERQAENRFLDINVKVGSQTYSLEEITDIPDKAKTQFQNIDFDKSLSEQERKKLWTDLGLSPANYAYLKTWQERDKQLGRMITTNLQRITEDNESKAEKYAGLSERYENNKDSITENSLLMDNASLTAEGNLKLGEIAELQAIQTELLYNKEMREQTPPELPRVSDSFNSSPFVPIIKGVEVDTE
jgi:hypothetical protein